MCSTNMNVIILVSVRLFVVRISGLCYLLVGDWISVNMSFLIRVVVVIIF